MSKIIKGGLLGGIVLFIWGAISWTVLPWHTKTLHQFSQESAVEVALANNAPHPGIYILPNPDGGKKGASGKEKEIRMKVTQEKMQKGPFAFVAMSPQGLGPMSRHLFIAILIQVLTAGLMTWLLIKTENLRYFEKVGFVVIFSLAASIFCELPNWNWWGFQTDFVLVTVLDHLVSGFLAGLVLAKITS